MGFLFVSVMHELMTLVKALYTDAGKYLYVHEPLNVCPILLPSVWNRELWTLYNNGNMNVKCAGRCVVNWCLNIWRTATAA